MSTKKKIVLTLGVLNAFILGLFIQPLVTQTQSHELIQSYVFIVLLLVWISLDERDTGLRMSKLERVLVFTVVGLPVVFLYLLRSRRSKTGRTLLKLLVYFLVLLFVTVAAGLVAWFL